MVPPVRRQNSKMSRLEAWLVPHAQQFKGGPTSFALRARRDLGFPVSKQMVWKILSDHGMLIEHFILSFTSFFKDLTKKKTSVVVSRSLPQQRYQHIVELAQIWMSFDQVLFVDEKQFLKSELHGRSTRFHILFVTLSLFSLFFQAMDIVQWVNV